MRTSVLVAVLSLIPFSFAHAQIPTAERDALIALYNATNGAGWTNKTGWETATLDTECTWFGVTCDGGQVTNVSLNTNQLSGTIPSELADLSNLERLWLFNNQLIGSIPPELGNLTWLGDLALDQNQLTGEIPPQLGNLTFLRNLFLYSNQLSGSIPRELGNLVSLQRLWLFDNQLTGSIPAELADPAIMWDLNLAQNQLSGSIPPELGSSQLWTLSLHNNQLSMSIPPELGSMPTLRNLYLHSNRLSGPIPPELGDLSNLEMLGLQSNKLSGSIPPELGNLPNLFLLTLNSNQLSGNIPVEFGNLSALVIMNIRFNALHTDNATLITFLNSKQDGGDWQSTQTIAPENLAVNSVGDHTAWLSWDAVSYQSNPGGYEVFSSPTGTGVWTSHGWTESKADITYPATGLDPATPYDFAVVTYTDPHLDNLNVVNSDFSPEVMATTATGGCAQPTIEIAWGDPITLSVSGSWGSYLWSTAETTSTIDIAPLFDQWYWVTVASTGPCEETGTVWVDPALNPIFADGFESGDTTEWSASVP